MTDATPTDLSNKIAMILLTLTVIGGVGAFALAVDSGALP
jgi:hypothetical protein